MTNQLALFFAAVIIAIFVADALVLHLDIHVWVFRRLGQLTEWVAFWR